MEKVLFNISDKVAFTMYDIERSKVRLAGEIVVVDAHGTFFNPDEVCYDVRLENGMWVKHIPQSQIEKI